MFALKNTADDAVVGAALAALKNADPVELAYGEYVLNKSEAEETFLSHFRENMRLDENFNPQPGSIAKSPVDIEEFIIYNPGEYPTTCPKGNLIQNTSIHVVIHFKAERPGLRGLFGKYVDITVHRDVDNLYFLKSE
ncbi:MAG: Uncharacterized protein XD50_0311 [Clostridia bacterium 41_269]|nr:MAG: Uncharacterized protein XD50_0311 [Clostridia bacterium 41_269]